MVGSGRGDPIRIALLNLFLFNKYCSTLGDQYLLFDIENDPEEKHNIFEQLPNVVKDIRQEVQQIIDNRPPQAKYWLISSNFSSGFQKEQCANPG